MASRGRARLALGVAWGTALAFVSLAGLQDLYGDERRGWIFVGGVAVLTLVLVAVSVPLFYGRSFVLGAAATYIGTGGWLSPLGTAVVGVTVFVYFALARTDEVARATGGSHPWSRFAPSPLALGLLLLAATVIAPIAATIPDISAVAGEPGEGEIDVGSYWGFDDQLDLAHRFELGDAEVMRVRAAEPDLWRGQTFDHYDGRNWTRRTTDGGGGYVRDLGAGAGSIAVVDATASRSADAEPHIQVFRYTAGVSDLVFAANDLWWAEVPAGVRSVNGDGTVRLSHPLGAGSTYTAFSLRNDPSPDQLRGELPIGSDGIYSPDSPYLQVPDGVPSRVFRLAREITASAPTTYDKVLAIEEWMDDHITYVDTRRLPPLPDGAEAVDHFLFEDRQGFCEQIGTSAAVMLRTLGIPARLATGFAPGERDGSRGEYVVREKDAHAWMEVWFPESGWVGFDPTSGVPVGPGNEPGALGNLDIPWSDKWWVLVIGAVVTAVVTLLWRRRNDVGTTQDLPERPIRTLQRLEAAGRHRGRSRSRSEPITDYAARLHREIGAGPGVFTVAESLNQTFYAGRDHETIDWDAVDAHLESALGEPETTPIGSHTGSVDRPQE